ncbi:MAG: GIY-YIG nuclease family protein [SAR324 cluster bacterium]|uniref:GIY-YIG nuclease family protein n=1 Tax=SAR324 cluster bacterium TaxID=2024889 RepID=A0A7X9ILH2_9DELT|nr:GIY-YIG nuclease family protein [SAR324 cluster bacterium]
MRRTGQMVGKYILFRKLLLDFSDYSYEMYYTYILKSQSLEASRSEGSGESTKNHFYVDCTSTLHRRFCEHSRGDCFHIAQSRPWKISNFTAFLTRAKAEEFERYLKTCSGRKFQRRHSSE